MKLSTQLDESVRVIRERIGDRAPTVGLILGSGLGGFADTLENAARIDYGDIPHFPVSTVHGHAGKLVVGDAGGLTCVAMQGRAHFYEGHSAARMAYPARTLVRLGAGTLIVTNAAGGVNQSFEPGTLMLIRDHINMLPDNPLRGTNDDSLGPRFPDMTNVYTPALRELARSVATAQGIEVREGVYASLSGPTYETPAEVRMLSVLGVDATGMSTVPEAIVARHMGARVLGISCITNKAAGLSDTELSHDEVTETAARVRNVFQGLLAGILAELATETP